MEKTEKLIQIWYMGKTIKKLRSKRPSASENNLEIGEKFFADSEGKNLPFSTTQIKKRGEKRQKIVNNNVKNHLRRICYGNSKEDNLKRLQSLLNIKSESEISPSAFNIPSIENMLSYHDLKEMEDKFSFDSGSLLSFNECISYRVVENQPEIMLTYVVLVEKALSNLGLTLSKRQNEKVFKGVWNIVNKYWKDSEQNVYKNISQKIEWGLFELLNFDLTASREERVRMEIKIKSLEKID